MLKSSWCKSSPARAVAGGPEASVAIRRVTGGCEAYTARTQAMSIQLRNLYIVAMPTPLALRKAASWRTFTARSAAVAGVPSPWHVFIETSREPRRAPCLSAHWGVVYPEDNRTGSAVAAEGHRQKRRSSAAEVICRQGKPEAAATGRRAVLRTHTTRECGEPQGSRKGRPRYPPEGRDEQEDVLMKNHMHETLNSIRYVKWN